MLMAAESHRDTEGHGDLDIYHHYYCSQVLLTSVAISLGK